MLDDGDIALNDLLIHIICGRVVLNGIKFWLCPYMVDGFIKQIALGRADFTDAPIVTADIILGRELSVFIGGVGVNQFLALVDAINRTCQSSVALRISCFHIGFRHGYIEFLEDVGKAPFCNLIPLNRGGLAFRNDIADCRVHFLHHIRGVAADKDIFKLCQSILIGYGVFIHGQTAEGSAVKVEFHAFHQIVLGSLDYFQTATLQGVVEINRGRLSTDERDCLGLLRLVTVNGLLCNRISARE